MKNMFRFPVIWELRKTTLYTIYTWKAFRLFKTTAIIKTGIKSFPLWWKYLPKELKPLEFDCPWITFAAKNHLDKILNKEMVIFEYGSGSSTLYFSRRVKEVYSIENERNWYNSLSEYLLNNNIKNVTYLLQEGILKTNVQSEFSSSASTCQSLDFEKYVKAISNFPDNFFDLVVVDGRARNACTRYAMHKVKKGGILMIDNSERSEYLKGNEGLLNSLFWKHTKFSGPVPYVFGFSQTSFFEKMN